MKEIRELNKYKVSLCSWIGRPNIVKMSVLPKLICTFNAVLIKIPASIFVDVNELVVKFTLIYGEAKDTEKPTQY